MMEIIEQVSLYMPALLVIYYAIGKVGETLKLSFPKESWFHTIGTILEGISDFLAGNRSHKPEAKK